MSSIRAVTLTELRRLAELAVVRRHQLLKTLPD